MTEPTRVLSDELIQAIVRSCYKGGEQTTVDYLQSIIDTMRQTRRELSDIQPAKSDGAI